MLGRHQQSRGHTRERHFEGESFFRPISKTALLLDVFIIVGCVTAGVMTGGLAIVGGVAAAAITIGVHRKIASSKTYRKIERSLRQRFVNFLKKLNKKPTITQAEITQAKTTQAKTTQAKTTQAFTCAPIKTRLATRNRQAHSTHTFMYLNSQQLHLQRVIQAKQRLRDSSANYERQQRESSMEP